MSRKKKPDTEVLKSMRVPVAHMDFIRTEAEAESLKHADIIRRAIREYVDRKKGK